MGPDQGPSCSVEGWIPSLVTGVGVVFVLVYVGEQLVIYGDVYVTSKGFVLGFFVSTVCISPLLACRFWLDRADLARKRYPRIVRWVFGGLVFFLATNLPVILTFGIGDFPFQFSWGRWAASVGASGGLLAGYVEARAIERELEAQRAAIRAEEAEKQRRWFDYLNGLLRHEVLNAANVIVGYAAHLLDDGGFDESTAEQLETIHRRGRDMTRVIRDVQVLIETTRDDARPEPKNLSEVLEAELDDLCDAHESVSIDAAIPDDLTVMADDLLPRLFSNVLWNAVEHNDSERPTVRVTVERDDAVAVVRVADDGPGIPERERTTLFERGDNTGGSHGLGLYLVRTLVERYGGSVELTDTGPDGSVFTFELPVSESAATDDAAARRGDSEQAGERVRPVAY